MERLVELFCHAIRISDPLRSRYPYRDGRRRHFPLLFLYALFAQLGELVATQREKRDV